MSDECPFKYEFGRLKEGSPDYPKQFFSELGVTLLTAQKDGEKHFKKYGETVVGCKLINSDLDDRCCVGEDKCPIMKR